ncbi:MAG: hypothetical protein C5B52_13445 [Bacteroidetes bacterium]|nr:MAG: hypothetical protein C5B52_13445 [Bacteroidota bacterium]
MKLRYLIITTVLLTSSLLVEAKPVIGSNDDDVNGVVMDADTRKPLKDVNVYAIMNSKKEKVAISDANGGFSFDDLKPGTYKLVFEKDGYKKIIREKLVIPSTPSAPISVKIEMEESHSASERGPSVWHFFDY